MAVGCQDWCTESDVDGVISLDRIGLEKVYVQAKRWQSSVGRPEIQSFYGALAGQRANRGVFITTSSFTSQAVEFAGSVERIVLVDGQKDGHHSDHAATADRDHVCHLEVENRVRYGQRAA